MTEEQSSISLKQLLGVAPIFEDKASNTNTIRKSISKIDQTNISGRLNNEIHKRSLIALLTGGSALGLGAKALPTSGIQGKSPN
ncbi:hypothetical protein HK096_006039 [Nowakowskiella sp. JEL0078]|nr:hypothetical protein HK096_006039 [Nowakowskiella sp. JEL0078]